MSSSITSNPQIAVLIVEDQAVSRAGLKFMMTEAEDIKVVAEASNGLDAISLCDTFRPDIVTMDISLPALSGIEATKRIKAAHPLTKVLMLTSLENEDSVFAALAAGADGYCLKDIGESALISAIRAVSTGVCWLDPKIAKSVVKANLSSNTTDGAVDKRLQASKFGLSTRETQILELLVDGMTNDQMARHLALATDTVKTHMRHILDKLAVSDRTQAAVKAIRTGIVSQ